MIVPVNSSGRQTRGKIISVHVSNYENGADFIIIQFVNSYKTKSESLGGESEQQAASCSCRRMFSAPCSLDPVLSCSILPVGSRALLLSHPFINQLSLIRYMKAR